MEAEAGDSTVIGEEHPTPRSQGTSKLTKIRFALSAEDQAAGVEAENLWAATLEDRRYRIDNVPFYVYGISLDDVVRAEEIDGRLVFREVVSRSGHSTYRVLVKDSAGVSSAGFTRLWLALEELGCGREIASRRWIAIDVPPTTNVFSVYRILESGEEQGVWSFDEGHCGHKV
jgi:hypothetical protein